MHNLYRERILELYKNPTNFHKLSKGINHRMINPMCGDDITLYLFVEDEKISDASFQGKGCALCIASSSLLTEKIKGMHIKDVLLMDREDIMKLLQIEVSANRLKCILLPLEATKNALEEKNATS